MTKTTVSLLPLLSPSLQTCNYTVGQHAPHWPSVKYDHQFGPYPFIAIPLPPMGGGRCSSPPAPFPPPHGHFTPRSPHPSQLPRRKASRWGISASTISTKWITFTFNPGQISTWTYLGKSSAFLFFFFFPALIPPPSPDRPHHLKTTYTKLKYEVSPFKSCCCKRLPDRMIDTRLRCVRRAAYVKGYILYMHIITVKEWRLPCCRLLTWGERERCRCLWNPITSQAHGY